MCTGLLPPGVNSTAVIYHIISYHITSHHITSYYIIYHIISYHIWYIYHIISHHIISYRIISDHIIYIISYYITSHNIISYHIISYHIISHHIISYHIISHHIISYHISYIVLYISYHITSYHIISYMIYISYHITSHNIISYHFISYNISYQKVTHYWLVGPQGVTTRNLTAVHTSNPTTHTPKCLQAGCPVFRHQTRVPSAETTFGSFKQWRHVQLFDDSVITLCWVSRYFSGQYRVDGSVETNDFISHYVGLSLGTQIQNGCFSCINNERKLSQHVAGKTIKSLMILLVLFLLCALLLTVVGILCIELYCVYFGYLMCIVLPCV
jgi:hypothetical protein